MTIQYNLNNLPVFIKFVGGRIQNNYRSDGVKMGKVVYDRENRQTLSESYHNDLVHNFNVPVRILHADGVIELNSRMQPTYFYHLKDHLGNVRAVVSPGANNTTVINQTNEYYPFGMAYSKNASSLLNPLVPNKYKYNGKEEQEMPGKWLDFGARYYDTQLGRWHSVDPMADQRSWVSPYNYCQLNPIGRVDPIGALDDWYKSEAGNVVWREGNAESITVNGEELKNIGTSYTTTVIGGDALIHHDQDKPTVIDLTSDVGKKYSMIAAEGGWIKQDGKTKRETEYGLLIISASMVNRLNYPKFFPNKGTYESLFAPSQYHAANSRTYKNIASQISTWESWYGTEDVMSYLDAVFNASHGSAVSTLQKDYKFANADKILGYAHNNLNLFGKYSINLGFDKTNTLIITVQSSSNVFPTLK